MSRIQGFQNRAPRVDLRRPAVLIDSDGQETDVIVLDVSRGGFRVEMSDVPRVGELVRLRVEHSEEWPAQIRWALGNQAGGVFLTGLGAFESEGGSDG